MPVIEPQVFNYSYNVMDVLRGFLTLEGEDRDDPKTTFFGVELEVKPKEGDEGQPPALDATYDELDEFAIAKSDASIGGEGGFEIVTVPATISKHIKTWQRFFDGWGRRLTKSWPNMTCGMHVHIGRDKLSTLALGKMLIFYNQPSNADFIQAVSGREEEQLRRWSSLTPHATMTHARYGSVPGVDRATAVNLKSSRNTVEIRLFRGNVQPEGFHKNLEMVNASLKFCQTVAAKRLSHQNFCDWIQDNKHGNQFQHLTDWAKAMGYIGTSASARSRLLSTYREGE